MEKLYKHTNLLVIFFIFFTGALCIVEMEKNNKNKEKKVDEII